MIALTDLRRKGALTGSAGTDGSSGSAGSEHLGVAVVTGSLAGIIIPPHFRQPTAALNCEKESLRWPGPFDTGFLSPQPPGSLGSGLSQIDCPRLGQRELVLFLFGRLDSVQERSTSTRSPPSRIAIEITPGFGAPPNPASRFQEWMISSRYRIVRLARSLARR